MTTAQRIQHLLQVHGDSLRKASLKTGVPKSTLSLILKGSEAHLSKWVDLIAEGYGLDPEILLGGADPKSDFEWSIRRANSRERFEYALMSIQERTRFTMEFLSRSHPRRCSPGQIALACGMQPKEVEGIVSRWERIPPDLSTVRKLVDGICNLLGMGTNWFLYGTLDDEIGPKALAVDVSKAGVFAMRSGMQGVAARTRTVAEIAIRRRR